MLNKLTIIGWSKDPKEKIQDLYESITKRHPNLQKVFPSALSREERGNITAGLLNQGLILDTDDYHTLAETKVQTLLAKLEKKNKKR